MVAQPNTDDNTATQQRTEKGTIVTERMGWPYPFEQFGANDPYDDEHEVGLLPDITVIGDRIDRALELETNWNGLEKIYGELDDAMEQKLIEQVNTDDNVFEFGQVIGIDNEYDLHENVLVDIVKFIRSSTIRNEQQFILQTLGYASGLMADPSDYNSTVTIGTSSSGKTHLKDQADRLYKHLNVMDASTGSDKVLIYSDDWDEADIISMGELNQPSDEMIEFMKRAHGGDEEVVIRSTRGNPHDGFHEEVIRKDAKSYHFTFAQFEADFEFWNRLLKIPVHESESKNRAVGRMAFDHGDIGIDDDAEYGYEFREGTERLQAHMLEMKRRAPKRVVVPNGAKGFDIDTWDILEPIFNHERSESNRVYTMVANLIKASALLNYQSRETIDVTTETTDGETITTDALLAEPQDVANVCRCLETLRATTHEIDARKRAVIEAIRTKGGDDNTVESLEPIVEYLEESDASQVNKPELEAIIDDLEADYLVTIDSGDITARNWDALGEPKIGEYAEAFAECVDPINGEPFLESWRDHRADVRADGSDLLGDVDIDSDPDDPIGAPDDTEWEPAGGDLEAYQRSIYTVVANNIDGDVVDDPSECSIEAFIGLTEPGEAIASVSTTGTLLDPDHDVWDVDEKPDSWVTTETDARRELQAAIRTFVEIELLGLEYTGEGVRINAETE